MRILEQCTAGELVSGPTAHSPLRPSKSEVTIVEFEPQIRTVKLLVPPESQRPVPVPVRCGKYIHTLVFPYIQFTYCQKSISVGMRNKPATSFRDLLFVPPLPNIYDSGQLCQPQGESLEEAIDVFWQSTFQVDDEWGGIFSLKRSEFKWYGPWEKMTRDNPEQALNYQWDEDILVEEDVESFIITRAKWLVKDE